jgi:hypothetical protein
MYIHVTGRDFCPTREPQDIGEIEVNIKRLGP